MDKITIEVDEQLIHEGKIYLIDWKDAGEGYGCEDCSANTFVECSCVECDNAWTPYIKEVNILK